MAKAKKGPNIRDFQKRFPDEDTCLKHLMRTRFGEPYQIVRDRKVEHWWYTPGPWYITVIRLRRWRVRRRCFSLGRYAENEV